jgi:outer membrane protein assembly factor BamB
MMMRIARRFLMVLAASALATGSLVAFAQDQAIAPDTPSPEPAYNRPFRLGFLPLNPQLDKEKPLAPIDTAGFVVNSGVLIGAFDSQWVGGMSMTTQKVLWWLDGKVTMTAPPGSFGAAVVLGFRDGRVVKVEALTGKRLWTAALDSFTERSFLLNGTTLYVVTASQVLYAIDFQSGKTLWMFDGGFPEGLSIRGGAKPIFFDGKVIFGVASGEVLGVAADTGKLLWRYNPAYNDARFHDVVGDMVIRNNKLIVSRYDGLVAAIDLSSAVRSVTWQEQRPGLTTSTFRGSRFYIGTLAGEVVALDPDNNGKQIWRTMTGAAVTNITAGETQIFVAGSEGRVTALDARTGDILWHDKLGSSLASPPVLFESSIYYTTGLKGLYAYRLR